MKRGRRPTIQRPPMKPFGDWETGAVSRYFPCPGLCPSGVLVPGQGFRELAEELRTETPE